jgi:hypothetical protein
MPPWIAGPTRRAAYCSIAALIRLRIFL